MPCLAQSRQKLRHQDLKSWQRETFRTFMKIADLLRKRPCLDLNKSLFSVRPIPKQGVLLKIVCIIWDVTLKRHILQMNLQLSAFQAKLFATRECFMLIKSVNSILIYMILTCLLRLRWLILVFQPILFLAGVVRNLSALLRTTVKSTLWSVLKIGWRVIILKSTMKKTLILPNWKTAWNICIAMVVIFRKRFWWWCLKPGAIRWIFQRKKETSMNIIRHSLLLGTVRQLFVSPMARKLVPFWIETGCVLLDTVW